MKRKGPNAKERLLRLMSDGRWHSMAALASAAGWRYGARLYDLKRDHGLEHETRKRGGRWEYRLTERVVRL